MLIEHIIDETWKPVFYEEFSQAYFVELEKYVEAEYSTHKCFPKLQNVFNAFNLCSLSDVKVVVLGQDPYHDDNQANGLSFSVGQGVKIPPSLMNIYKELRRDYGWEIPISGDLMHWAKQGVLMINSTLTVRAHQAGSHKNHGWEVFTDNIIKYISQNKTNVVFLLWGAYAQKKQEFIDSSKHLILTSPHPSPLSAHKGFIGNGHFSKTNQYLMEHDITPIEWCAKVL